MQILSNRAFGNARGGGDAFVSETGLEPQA
jgi:hypothetical protein